MGSGLPATTLVPAIIHVDMDAFFASVEVLDHPEWSGKPVVVGGSGARGVVASCTYEARAFGVHSAMPSARARQLCPQAIFADGHYARYSEVSSRLHEVLRAVTPIVEPIGLDEAFLDVTGAGRLLGPPEVIAPSLRVAVRDTLSLDCSVGVGRSKLIAKLASRAAKPVAGPSGINPGGGVVLVTPQEELEFLHPMPVEALWGVGPATARRLRDLGVRTIGDLAALPVEALIHRLGRALGTTLGELARAHDPRPVVAQREPKSIGHEETFREDVHEPEELRRRAGRLAEAVAAHLRDSGLSARTVNLRVRFADFSTIARSHSLPFPVDTAHALTAVTTELLDDLELPMGVRLLGVSASSFRRPGTGRQLTFELGENPLAVSEDDHAGGGDDDVEAVQGSWSGVAAVVDAIRARFGRRSVGTASMIGPEGLAVPRQRDAPWGPSEPPQHETGPAR